MRAPLSLRLLVHRFRIHVTFQCNNHVPLLPSCSLALFWPSSQLEPTHAHASPPCVASSSPQPPMAKHRCPLQGLPHRVGHWCAALVRGIDKSLRARLLPRSTARLASVSHAHVATLHSALRCGGYAHRAPLPRLVEADEQSGPRNRGSLTLRSCSGTGLERSLAPCSCARPLPRRARCRDLKGELLVLASP